MFLCVFRAANATAHRVRVDLEVGLMTGDNCAHNSRVECAELGACTRDQHKDPHQGPAPGTYTGQDQHQAAADGAPHLLALKRRQDHD